MRCLQWMHDEDGVSGDFRRPVRFGGPEFAAFEGGQDPAQIHRIARDTARALVERVRDSDDDELLTRVVEYTDRHGIEAIAELWARSGPATLPGALWRIYLLRTLIRQQPDETALLFQRGTEVLDTIDAAIAGAVVPAGPAEITELADRILRGVFRGDLAVALDRAAAFCRVTGAGSVSVADDRDATDPDRASAFTRRALRYSELAGDLAAAASRWRAGSLE